MRLVALVLPLLLALTACGYRAGSLMPSGVTDVAVELFGHDTRPETRYRFAEVTYTRLLTRELVRRAHVRIRDPQEARILIRGTFIRMERAILVEDDRDQPLESAFFATVRVEVVDASSGEPFMNPFLVTRRDSRIIGRGETLQRAIDEVMRKLAQDTVNRLQAEEFYRDRMAPASRGS